MSMAAVHVQLFTAGPGLCLQAAAESEMLTEVQWRVAALEALHAFVLGPCTRCAPMQAATLTATCASLLQPTLDAVCAAPALQVNMPDCSICQGSRGMAKAPATCVSCCCTFSVMVKCADTISMAVACWSPSTTWQHSVGQCVLNLGTLCSRGQWEVNRRSSGCLPVHQKNGPKAVCRCFPHHGMPFLQDPWRSGSGPNSPFAGAAALLQLRLLQAYLLLPKAGAFAPEHASLLRLCASALKGTSAPSGTTHTHFTTCSLGGSCAMQSAQCLACFGLSPQSVG